MRLLLLLVLAVTVLVACPHVVAPECEEISGRCHELAESPNATATQKECHESAEQKWNAADCTSNKARCNTACPLPDGGM